MANGTSRLQNFIQGEEMKIFVKPPAGHREMLRND